MPSMQRASSISRIQLDQSVKEELNQQRSPKLIKINTNSIKEPRSPVLVLKSEVRLQDQLVLPAVPTDVILEPNFVKLLSYYERSEIMAY